MFQFHFLNYLWFFHIYYSLTIFFLYSILIGLENNQGRTFRHAPLFLKLFFINGANISHKYFQLI